LNEAFATFIGVAACDAYKPEWDRWTLFAFERSEAFEIDSLQSTRSVEFPVKSPKEADAMFDVLTYEKGGSLLRMLEMFIGKDRFRNGLRKYLKKYSYKNTETNDLWDTIEKTLKNDGNGFIPVRNIMNSWIFQKGYPLISVKLDLENNIIFQQERFTFSKSNQVDPTIWSIPIHFRDDNDGVEKKVLLNTREMRVKIANSSKPVVVNANSYGFYRVTYSAELFARFDATTISNMKVIERYNLIDDAWNAVIADRVSAIEYLNFLDNFSNERDVAVWEVIVKNLSRCQRILPNNKQHLFKSRIMNLTKPAFDSITWNSKSNEDNRTKKLRSILITLMAYNANDFETQKKAREIFNNVENGETIDAELLEAVTTIVSFSGGETEFNLFKNKFRFAETPQDKLTALYALANFQSEELIKNACEFALSNEVKTQDAPSFINSIIANRNYGGIAWNFVKERWNEIKQKYIGNGIDSLIGNIKLLNTSEQLADVKDFFIINATSVQEFKQILDQIIERQSVNVELRIREEVRLINALSS
jgi:puromycin-sensitive aminopeptidase